jgi:hypothetical protein
MYIGIIIARYFMLFHWGYEYKQNRTVKRGERFMEILGKKTDVAKDVTLSEYLIVFILGVLIFLGFAAMFFDL